MVSEQDLRNVAMWVMLEQGKLISGEKVCSLPHSKGESDCVFCEALLWRRLVKKISGLAQKEVMFSGL